ncbi:type II toxin-antitoxin system Phd/YefM family antitoxin [Rheinheimera soli]|uniref:type II toxin-antitoxin system Phd/YefM family antitoxin n=1 Tax=Rheinheimera soli TaxID=443616 RepID=UPI001E477D98|nr:type II toxin-antitoxin system Phd/YefM family antitoxin [Rheinheimera soli]
MSNEKVLETLGIREFRNKLKETLERVDVFGERILLGKHGKSVAALVPVEDVDLAIQMEQKIAESVLLNDENFPLSAPSETSLDELMVNYTPKKYDSSRYGAEVPNSLQNALNELSCAVENRQMGQAECSLLVGVIRKLAEKISSASDIRSITSVLTQAMMRSKEGNVLQTQVIEISRANDVFASRLTNSSPGTDPTEVAAAIAHALLHSHD